MSIESLQESSKLQKLLLKVHGTILSEYFDKYKKHFWAKKEYK
jgi:hypothetical protein